MGIWRVARHAPGRPGSQSPVLRRRAPSNPQPPRNLSENKGRAQIHKRCDCILIVNDSSHPNEDDVQSHF
eukprot:63241-Pelagomonas_calceolata.AAC.1